jgi:hypothetical protein
MQVLTPSGETFAALVYRYFKKEKGIAISRLRIKGTKRFATFGLRGNKKAKFVTGFDYCEKTKSLKNVVVWKIVGIYTPHFEWQKDFFKFAGS